MQTVLSPAVGAMVDRWGFEPVCAILSLMPLAACGVLTWSRGKDRPV
jgi:hypothetical protein